MKKTLIALALATLSTASFAEVVLYGQIDAGVETHFGTKNSEVNGTENSKVKGTTAQIVDYGSRIGFKGRENVASGLDVIWQLEQDASVGGSKGFGTGSRESFIGLQGEIGAVKAGYQNTPIRELNGKLDQWEYSSSVGGLGVFTRTNQARRRAIAATYETPVFGGFSAKAFVSPSDNNNGEAGDNVKAEDRKKYDSAIYGLSASYKNPELAGFYADVAGTYVKASTKVMENGQEVRKDGYQALAQVGVENDVWGVGAAYQRSHRVDDTDSQDPDKKDSKGNYVNTGIKTGLYRAKNVNEAALSGFYTVSQSIRLKGSAAYGWNIRDEDNNKLLGNGKYWQGIVGADYLLSKRTTVNAQYGHLRLGNGAEQYRDNIVSVGMKHKF